MTAPRRSYSAEFKAKIALEAVKGRKTTNHLAAEHGGQAGGIELCGQERRFACDLCTLRKLHRLPDGGPGPLVRRFAARV